MLPDAKPRFPLSKTQNTGTSFVRHLSERRTRPRTYGTRQPRAGNSDTDADTRAVADASTGLNRIAHASANAVA